jgi:hypothetical protein
LKSFSQSKNELGADLQPAPYQAAEKIICRRLLKNVQVQDSPAFAEAASRRQAKS